MTTLAGTSPADRAISPISPSTRLDCTMTVHRPLLALGLSPVPGSWLLGSPFATPSIRPVSLLPCAAQL